MLAADEGVISLFGSPRHPHGFAKVFPTEAASVYCHRVLELRPDARNALHDLLVARGFELGMAVVKVVLGIGYEVEFVSIFKLRGMK